MPNLAEIVCGFAFVVLIVGMAAMPYGIGQFIHDYQTILAGTIGSSIAVAAAFIAWKNVQRQIGRQEKLEEQRRHRAGFAARASLPLALSYYCSYASECLKFLANLRRRAADEAVEVVLLPEDLESAPELGSVDKRDSQISCVLIQGSFGGSYCDQRFVERQGVGLS